MITLSEIEEAVEMLPGSQQKALLQRLDKRLGGAGASCYDPPDFPLVTRRGLRFTLNDAHF